MVVYKLVLLRHGESTWNKENRFTGWTDVPLSQLGEKEAIAAGQILKERNYQFDYVFTSYLKRAVHTTWSVLKELDQSYLQIENSWRLNERHYGALQGLNKVETAKKHGEEKVKMWRRSYAVAPDRLDQHDPRWPGNEKMYANVPKRALPFTESLKDTVDRVLPVWYDSIAPMIFLGKKVLICAHGNSLRALVKHLDNLSESEIVDLNIPTGVPLVYELNEDLTPLRHYYLMEENELKAKMDAVEAQGKVAPQK